MPARWPAGGDVVARGEGLLPTLRSRVSMLYGSGECESFSVSAAQASAQLHLLRTVGTFESADFLERPREAMRLLLGSTPSPYGAEVSSTVRPFVRDQLSLSESVNPVSVDSLPGRVDKIMNSPDMLLEPDDIAAKKVAESDVQLFMDKVLQKDESKYYEFLSMLQEASMLTYVSKALGRVTPFC